MCCDSIPSITEKGSPGKYPEDDGRVFIEGVQSHLCYFDVSKISHMQLANYGDYSETITIHNLVVYFYKKIT